MIQASVVGEQLGIPRRLRLGDLDVGELLLPRRARVGHGAVGTFSRMNIRGLLSQLLELCGDLPIINNYFED